MARTHLTDTVAAAEPVAVDTADNTEAQVADAPAADPAAEAAAAELAAKIEATVDAFKAAADAAIEERDDEGHLNPDQLSPVVQAYRAIEGGAKGKSAAKAHIIGSLKTALTSGKNGYPIARAWNLIQDAVATAPAAKAGGSTRTPATPVSETELFVAKVTALQLAISLVQDNVPEGVATDWEDKVDELIAASEADVEALYTFTTSDDAEGDAPETSAVVKQAVKLAVARGPKKATGKVAATGERYQGTRRDVAVHILNAFADKPAGTFLTVAEIKATPSEEYGTDSPSPGAISARLFPKSGKLSVEGIQPGQNDKGVNGATKL